MQQVLANRLPRNELGFAGCVTANGQHVAGPVATGTPTSVDIPLRCPPGAKLSYLFHSHPGGVAYPSPQDIKSALRFQVPVLCIASDKQLECFRIERR